MSHPVGARDWWEDLYDERLAELFLVRSDDEVRAEVAFLIKALGLAPGDRVFDQCCGVGGLSLGLARAGMRVVGVDLSRGYVRRARRDAAAEGLACDFVEADAFDFVPARPCDAAFNWWTGFGYDADDRRHALMLRRAFEALRPGGSFVLDFQNIARVVADFRPCIVRRGATAAGEVLLIRESTLDLAGGLLRQQWTFVAPDGRRTVRPSAVRLYLPHALAALLHDCGFTGVEFFGDVGGGPLTRESPRCIVLARRPAP